MKYIPDLMIHRIEREQASYEEGVHPSIEQNEKVKRQIEQNLLAIHNSVNALKGSNPGAWSVYEEALLSMYATAKKIQNEDFFHLITLRADPQYFTYAKIFSVAQVQILEAILSVAETPIENLKKNPKKSSNKVVDKFKDWIIRKLSN